MFMLVYSPIVSDKVRSPKSYWVEATFCCFQLLLFLGGVGGGGGGDRKRRLDKRMVGVNSCVLIAICLVLKAFGCLFLLFSNPRIPLLKLPAPIYREPTGSCIYAKLLLFLFFAMKYWEAWCLVAILDRPRRSASIGASKSFYILSRKSNVFYDSMELMQLSHYDLKGRRIYY